MQLPCGLARVLLSNWKAEVGGSRPPLTTPTLSGFRGGFFFPTRATQPRALPPTLRLGAGWCCLLIAGVCRLTPTFGGLAPAVRA
jgi:hypothetical protein